MRTTTSDERAWLQDVIGALAADEADARARAPTQQRS
jgi:hypothetical protein